MMIAPEPTTTVDLAECYYSMRSHLVRLAMLLSGSRETAEDVVQAVFLEAQRHWRHVANPHAYLRRSVVNGVKDTQRRAFRGRALRPEPPVVTGVPEIDETWRLVCSLPPRQREVVVLRFYEDLSLVETANVLGRNPATVRSDLHRALNRLRRTIDD
jgi:DNA-directed RNA polymerase specialized sigma24 family protein